MKRVLVISEEFGLFRAETSDGRAATGAGVADVLDKLGVDMGIHGSRDLFHIFDNIQRVRESDVPRSSV
jgi:hypothetical protein